MSLEDLLATPEEGSIWKIQKAKLARVLFGIGIALAALGTGVVLYFGLRPSHQAPASAGQEATAQNLARLMQIRRQTQDLQNGLAPRPRRGPAAMPGASGQGEQSQIISYDPGEGYTLLAQAKSDLYIPTGAVFQAQMLTPIKTSVARTFVMAETTHEFRMDMKRRIQRGSRLIGRSYFDPVLKGVVVEFDTVVSPQGQETSVNGLALSRNALPELEGLYFSNHLETYGTALAFGFLSGFAGAGQEREFTLLGSQPQVNLNNQVLSGLSTASFQVAEQMLRDIQSRAIEYVVVPAGEQVFVVLTRRYEIAQGEKK